MDWVNKLQRERSHIATITMNPKFMFLTIIVVVVGDHNYRNLIRVRYRICFQGCLQRGLIMPTTSNVLHTTTMTPIVKDAKMKSQKKGGEYFTSQGMQCFKMCNSWCKKFKWPFQWGKVLHPKI